MLKESAVQQACVQWFRLQYPNFAHVLIHVPNEGRRDVKLVRRRDGTYRYICPSASRLKAEGMVVGAADLLLLVPRKGYGCLGIEMKSEEGVLRDTQAEWGLHFTQAGNKYAVCRSLEGFIKEVREYLEEM